MTLPNTLILALVSNGLGGATEHDVPAADAYKAYKFRSAIEKANKDLDEKRQGLVKSAGIEDGQKFDGRIKELRAIKNPTEEQQKELDEMQEKLKKFNELYTELMNDETELEGIKTMPYESYHALAAENKAVKVGEHTIDLFTVFAGELENILWVAPAEE